MKWRRLVSEQTGSGQTVKAFCREQGLCRPYSFLWKKRLKEGTPTEFLEVRVTERGRSTPGDAGVEVRLNNGRSLMVKPGFDAEHLRALLAVVEAAG